MPLRREATGASIVDVLDRVLDRGIVIDAHVRISLVDINLITVEARVLVASIETFLKHADGVAQTAPLSRSGISSPFDERPVPVGSSRVKWYSSVSGSTRAKRSTS